MSEHATRRRRVRMAALGAALLGLVLLPILLPGARAQYIGFLLSHGEALGGMLLSAAALAVAVLVVHLSRPDWRPVTRCMLLSLGLHMLLILYSGLFHIEAAQQQRIGRERRVRAEFARESLLENSVGETVRDATLNLRAADSRPLAGPRADQALPLLREPEKPKAAPASPETRAPSERLVAAPPENAAAPKPSVEEKLASHAAPAADATKPAVTAPVPSVPVNSESAPTPVARAIETAKAEATARAAAGAQADRPQPKMAESVPAPLAGGRIAAPQAKPQPQITESLAVAALQATTDQVTPPAAMLPSATPPPAAPSDLQPAAMALARTPGQVEAPASARPTAAVTLHAAPARPATLAADPQPIEGTARIALVPAAVQATPVHAAQPDRVGHAAAALIEVAAAAAEASARPGSGAVIGQSKRAGRIGAAAGGAPGRPAPVLADGGQSSARGSMAAGQLQPVLAAEHGGTMAEVGLAPASAAAGAGGAGSAGTLRGLGMQMAAAATTAPEDVSGAGDGTHGSGRAVTTGRLDPVGGIGGGDVVAAPRPDLGALGGGAATPGTLVADSGQPVSEGQSVGAGIPEGVTAVALSGGVGVDAIVAGTAPTVPVSGDGENPGSAAGGAVPRGGGAVRASRAVLGGAAAEPSVGRVQGPTLSGAGAASAGAGKTLVGGDVPGVASSGMPAVAEDSGPPIAGIGDGLDEMIPITFSPGVDAQGEPVYATGDGGRGPAGGARAGSMQVAKVEGKGSAGGGAGYARALRRAGVAGGGAAASGRPLRVVGKEGGGAMASGRVTLPESLGIDREQRYRSVALAAMQESPGKSRQKLIYSLRSPEKRRDLIGELGGSVETERAVEKALAWLAKAQSSDGRWDVDEFENVAECGGAGDRTDGDVGVTGLALLAYLGTGYTHNRGDYQETMRKALDWLVAGQSANGDLRRGGQLYVQAMATAALCESYSLSGDAHLLEPAQRAVQFVLDSQNPEAGWRYQPKEDSDTSVTGWQVLALKSAEIAGIAVPPERFHWTAQWLDKVRRGKEGGLYAYKEGHGPTPVMTAEGWFCQLFMGQDQRTRGEAESARYLMANLPEWDPAQRGVIHFYYWYYATLALHLSGSSEFDAWNAALRGTLLKGQRQDGPADGSWDPVDQLGERGGRMYSTTMATLCLEVYYRYLPFYRVGER